MSSAAATAETCTPRKVNFLIPPTITVSLSEAQRTSRPKLPQDSLFLRRHRQSALALFGLPKTHTKNSMQPGFTPFGIFFLALKKGKEDFPLLVGLESDTLLQRYHALMTNLRVSVQHLLTCSL
ncbi:hypothetical protein VP01_1792g9 [Puccinia sorghi]|uniref:Uncharacterized protein n=1 Tax=Puccinia sorghi TaxID=27349 RepID=A0A0L6VGD1_9BASI|nr:hypothetical protein VP01_1792g9 [Puccinia sorghi]